MFKKKKIQNKGNGVNNFSDSEFFFDDCIICQGIKKAEEVGKDLNVDDLKKLFKKANKEKQK